MRRVGLFVIAFVLAWVSIDPYVGVPLCGPTRPVPHRASAASPPIEEFEPAYGVGERQWLDPLGVFTPSVVEQGLLSVGARDFPPENRPDGNGIVIAIIGSGVDPGHRDLQDLPGAATRKIVDWADFSDEGLVETELALASGGWTETRYGRLRTGGLRSAGGGFRVGVLREESLDPAGAIAQDLNGNGSTTDVFPVLAVDQSRNGIYSRVYVDTNQNRDFTDEVPLGLFSQGGAFSRFRDRTGTVSAEAVHFVVGDIAQDGSRVRLGFDSHGTGTFLAGVIAGGGGAGGMDGVAPGASIMSLKVLDSTGQGSWESLSRAIIHASRNGARVLLVDTGATRLTIEQIQSLRELTVDVVSRYGVVVLYAAGDGGPGLETSKSAGDSISSLTVGGVTGGSRAPAVWCRSAVGPTPAGGWAPDILAPVNAASTVPSWFSRSGYALGRGTTVSAAYAAGCAALVLDACRRNGVSRDASQDAGAVLEALIQSGTPVGGAQLVEQGGGIVNAGRAFRLLQMGIRAPMTVISEEPGGHREGGVLARDFSPGAVRFYVDNFSGRDASVGFASDVEWVTPGQERLLMPPVGERSFLFEYGDTPAGLSSGVVYGLDEKSSQVAFRTRHVLVRPRSLSLGEVTRLESGDSLQPGEWRRHFILVSSGTTLIVVTARNSGTEEASVQVIGPKGVRTFQAQVAPGADWTRRIVQPEAGVWEIVLFKDGGDSAARVELATRAEGFSITPWLRTVNSGKTPEGKARLTFGLAATPGDITVRLVPSKLRDSDGRRVAGLAHDVVTIPAGQALHRSLTVTDGIVRLYISASHPSESDAVITLYLHRYDPQAGWKEVASSVDQGSPAGTIDLADPLPGSYMVYVESAQDSGDVQCELFLGLFERNAALVPESNTPVYLGKGKVMPVSLLVESLSALEDDEVHIQVVDDRTGRLVTCLPLSLAGYGTDELGDLSVGIGGPAPGGKRYVTMSIGPDLRDSLAYLSLVVDGKTYSFEDGRVTLPLKAPGEVQVTLLRRGKPVMSKTLVIEDLPWNPANTPEPGTDPEKEVLRRSLMRRLGF
ncbi:MAG: S8 family serine peptidase [Ignavibacteriales bacterium]